MKLSLGKILAIVAAVLGLVSVFMIFAPYATAGEGDFKVNYTGLNVIFGTDVEVAGVKGKLFAFSIVNLLPLIFAVVGVVCAILALLGKGGKVVPIVAAVAFLVAGILYFCAVQGVTFGDAYKDAPKEKIKAMKKMLDLGAGAIVGGIFSILAAIASGVSLVFAKKD